MITVEAAEIVENSKSIEIGGFFAIFRLFAFLIVGGKATDSLFVSVENFCHPRLSLLFSLPQAFSLIQLFFHKQNSLLKTLPLPLFFSSFSLVFLTSPQRRHSPLSTPHFHALLPLFTRYFHSLPLFFSLFSTIFSTSVENFVENYENLWKSVF